MCGEAPAATRPFSLLGGDCLSDPIPTTGQIELIPATELFREVGAIRILCTKDVAVATDRIGAPDTTRAQPAVAGRGRAVRPTGLSVRTEIYRKIGKSLKICCNRQSRSGH
jgi:hypothetical protein